MKFIDNFKSELYREYYFWSEQKLGWKRPVDPYCIPKHLLRKYLPANAVIIDCGASIGSDSVELSRIFPHSVIHSIEAVPDMYQLLKANTRKYKNITCYEFGLSSITGRAKMHISSGATLGASSLLPPKTVLDDHPNLFFKDVIEVNTLTLDDWADKNNVTRVDFLWLDMQGSEFEVLKASKKIFNTVKAIHTEVSTKETYENVPLYSEFRKWLQEKGFSVIKEAIPEGTDMGNVLFVKN